MVSEGCSISLHLCRCCHVIALCMYNTSAVSGTTECNGVHYWQYSICINTHTCSSICIKYCRCTVDVCVYMQVFGTCVFVLSVRMCTVHVHACTYIGSVSLLPYLPAVQVKVCIDHCAGSESTSWSKSISLKAVPSHGNVAVKQFGEYEVKVRVLMRMRGRKRGWLKQCTSVVAAL